jgi:isocitrate dehydrogenase (NAD+)
MAYNVTLIPGDGIGPEVSEAMRRVVEATGVQFNWDIQEAGEAVLKREGELIPDRVLDSIRKNKVGIKGPLTTPVGTGFRSANVALRKALDLYANLRPAKSYPGVRSRYTDVDIIIVRENTEDLYAGIEFEKGSPEAKEIINEARRLSKQPIRDDSAISLKAISVTGSERIVRFAFEYAKNNGRKKVTAVHKANIMKYSDGLFLQVAGEVAKEYPSIEFEDRIVDNLCMQLVSRPEEYDVLVLPNLYGDIVSDLCAGLVGGLGLAPGGNIGELGAVFEPVHGSAPRYTGQNKVNPVATILSGSLMLRHLGEQEAAERVERAVADVIREGKDVTYDFKQDRNDPSAVGTREMADAIIKKVRSSGR